MHRRHVFRAWKWLLSHLLIAASIGYLAVVLLAGFGLVKPSSLLQSTSFGLSHAGGVIVDQGSAIGLDQGVMIFLCNLMVATLIVANVYWSRLLNPRNQHRLAVRLHNALRQDPSAEYLRRIKPFSRIQSPQLLLTAFLLLGAPYIATVALGLMAGALLGVALIQTSSPLVALAYIVPHGIPEIAALLLACSIPIGVWMAIRPVVGYDCPSAAFRRIDRLVGSQQFQQDLKLMINLLMIAGLIEAHFTLKVVALFSGS